VTAREGSWVVTENDRSAPANPLASGQGSPSGALAGNAPGGQSPKRGDAGGRTHSAQPSSRRSRGPVYAALDLGTNNCRLLIARPHELVCEELCGPQHNTMRGDIIIVSRVQYRHFITKQPPTTGTPATAPATAPVALQGETSDHEALLSAR